MSREIRMRIETFELDKRFGKVVALDDVSLTMDHAELYTLLGPSGCGKTTFLRAIAGFDLPDSGKIMFDGADVTNLPAYKRNTGMVFQNYALWPHMSVFENIAFGLRIKKTKQSEIKKRVEEVLRMVRLEGLEERTPHQLSGGQQQRVAVARALVINPRVLLFDEPLSNLDAKLRLEMRAEIKRIQQDLKITALYVTHDQEEAMSISDRIAVMHRGRVMQIGSPMDIYFRPQNSFVADFIGQATFLKGKAVIVDKIISVQLDIGGFVEAVPSDPANPPQQGDEVLVAIRPENFNTQKQGKNEFNCEVVHVAFLGRSQRVVARMNGTMIIAETPPEIEFHGGEKVTFWSETEKTLAIRTQLG